MQPSEDGAVSGGQGEDETAEQSLKAHPDADTYFLMTKPTGMGLGELLDDMCDTSLITIG